MTTLENTIDRIADEDGRCKVRRLICMEGDWEVATPLRTLHVTDAGTVLSVGDPYNIDWKDHS